MSESGSGDEGLPAVLINEKGRNKRNKRKCLSKLPLEIPIKLSAESLTEFPRYEMPEEKLRKAMAELKSMMQRSEDTIEEQSLEDYEDTDWDDPVACQLEELLANNLFAALCSAVKRIVEFGYTEQVAEWAVLNSSLFHGNKDVVSNIVDYALTLLKREKDINTQKPSSFEGFQTLVDYTLLEMIHVLREVRPDLTVAEAMWCLLVSDLSLVKACVLEGGSTGGSSCQEASGDSQMLSQSKSENSSNTQSDSNNLARAKQMMPQGQNAQAKAPVTSLGDQQSICKSCPGELGSPGEEGSLSLEEEKGNSSSQGNYMDEKSGGSRKGLSSSSKREMLRQKTFQFEKNYKGRISKGALKAKVAAWGSMVLDKPLKSQSSSSVTMKEMYSKLMAPAETSSSSVEGKDGVHTSIFKDPTSTFTAGNSKSHKSSVPITDPHPKGDIIASDTPKMIDYSASIPFDKTLQKYVPQDDRDEDILTLVPHKQALEKELQGWMDWANEKVMQAARRLGKDQAELKMLRQEKEEVEKYKKDKQTLEESTMKRLSEMEYALSNATCQIEMANSTVLRLEEENDVLKKEMEVAKMKSLRSASNLQEALVREQEYLKKIASWETEKGLILDQVAELKNQTAALSDQLEKAKRRWDQFKDLLRQEEKEKLRAAKQINLFREKKEAAAALLKVKADSIKLIAEEDVQQCKDSIRNLEGRISGLRLESDKSKIAALNVGYGNFMGMQPLKTTKRLAVLQDNFEAGDVKPERECVMCMADEISVVFLPCAHQVLCGQCSALHEKQGMNDCPSCRTTIQNRISVTYQAD